MVKVDIKNNEPKYWEYPCLVHNDNFIMIALEASPTIDKFKGVILANKRNATAYFSIEDGLNCSAFQIYNGSITLTNEQTNEQ